MRRRLPIALLAALPLGVPTPALACPNCKEAVASQEDPNAARLAAGYSYSIYLMMGMPALLVGAGGLAVARAVRRGLLPEM